MKYGVIVYRNTRNIGDDIQSYAASKLLPQVDYYIEREQLDTFRPKEDEPVNAIMNGWFMYNKLAWPVSPCINPLYISMHFWKNDALGIDSSFLKGHGGEELRQYAPIGCRDTETQQMLEDCGIKTWFSGCLTLTLKPTFPQTEGGYICLVNVSEKVAKYINKQYPDEAIRKIDQEADGLVKQRAEWGERFSEVEKLLTIYQNAKAVVTTRLHCAMPCLALGTPVLLLTEDGIAEQGRFDGLLQYVRHAAEKEFLAGEAGFNLRTPTPNSDAYLACSRRLEENVRAFLADHHDCTPEARARFARFDAEWTRRAKWKNEQLERLSHQAIQRWKENNAWMEELTAANAWNANKVRELEQELLKRNQVIESLNTELDMIKNSRGYRILEKVRAMRRLLACRKQ